MLFSGLVSFLACVFLDNRSENGLYGQSQCSHAAKSSSVSNQNF